MDINADQNFYSRRPATQSPNPQYYQQLQLQDQPQPQSRPHQPYEAAALPASQPRSPNVPPKLPFLTIANLQAVTANGFNGGLSGGGDPDEFYREYRGVQHSTRGYTDITSNGMTASVSESRPLPSTLRSNGNGTSSKHPPLSAARSSLRTPPSYRSASAPIGDYAGPENTRGLSNNALSGKPSVKEMTKRFDTRTQNLSSTTRRPVPRVVTTESNTSGPGYMKERGGYQARITGDNETTTTSKAGVLTREAGVKQPFNSRTTQRTRFAPEDQHSNNTLSGTARATRPRNSVAGTISQASKSMNNLSPTSPKPPPHAPARRPLFGEVFASEHEIDIGYGIPHAATRRTSESSLHHPRSSHLRSKSNLDISPSSPTAWYLGVTPALEDVDTNQPGRSPGHNRNHSDFVDSRVNTMNGVGPSFQPSISSVSHIPRATKPPSRLPIIKKASWDSSSPTSSIRSNSPFMTKPVTKRSFHRPEERPWTPAGRSTPPVTHTKPTPGSRTSTPTRSRAKAREHEQQKANSSLTAVISSPPIKTSPPLRSSRPRQPVSSASTASSRQRATDRSGSPQNSRTGMRVTRNGKPDEQKEREFEDKPVDYGLARKKIQRAYTNSMQKSKQDEVRAANMARLNARTYERTNEQEQEKRDSQTNSEPSVAASKASASPTRHLHVSTSFIQPTKPLDIVKHHDTIDIDSPTLGIPGSFVDEDNDEAPASAVSNATGITDFDHETQTEPAFMRFNPRPLSTQVIEWDQLSPEQATFGVRNSMQVEDGTIQMMLDASPLEEVTQESTPTNDVFTNSPAPPGAFKRDSEYEQLPVFAARFTSPSPKATASTEQASHSPMDTRHSSTEAGNGSIPSTGDSTRLSDQRDVTIRSKDFMTSQIHPPPELSFDREHVQHLGVHTPESDGFQQSDHTPLASESSGMNNVHDYLSTPVTDMDYDSSDSYGGPNLSEPEYYNTRYKPHQESRPSYHIRTSHQSTWTDCSVNSRDGYSEHPPAPTISDLQDAKPLPLFASEDTRAASPQKHQLPPVATGEGFGITFSDPSPALVDSDNSGLTQWPDYAPPPPPPPPLQDSSIIQTTRSTPPLSLNNRRPPSSIYQSSQNGASRNADSRRASDDVYSLRPSMSTTPRSSTQISLEDVTSSQPCELKDEFATEEEKIAAEKAKAKLKQRMMIIRELIDTESVYVKDMNVVEEIYKGTAEACPNLDGNDIKSIFRNTKDIVVFHTELLEGLKNGASSIYSPRSNRSRQSKAITTASTDASSAMEDRLSIAATLTEETDAHKDCRTSIGATFVHYLPTMQSIYTEFLRNQEVSSSRLTILQADPAVKVWLNECNTVAKDLTAAWDLDALLVKPVQRITRYKLLLADIIKNTADDHPDLDALRVANETIGTLLTTINELKKRVELVGKIVGRKRKESDVRIGFAKAFGRRAEKIQATTTRPNDDPIYLKLHERYSDDYLRLQIVLRDAEFYTRNVTAHVNDFLRLLLSMELVMRGGQSSSPEIESKWVRFNMSMRDMGTVALEDHISAVRSSLIEPLELVIATYSPPELAMKKRAKRRLDYEKYLLLKSAGKGADAKLKQLVVEYEALNDTLKLELPKLSALTQKISDICTAQFVNIQAQWFQIWQEKVRVVLEERQIPRDLPELVDMFSRDYKYVEARAQDLGIINGTFLDTGVKSRTSQSTTTESKGRPSNLSSRSRGISINSDRSPSLPTPNYSGQFSFSPIVSTTPGNTQAAMQNQSFGRDHSRNESGSPATPDTTSVSESRQLGGLHARPSTGRSFTSENGMPRASNDYNTQHRRESGSTHNSGYHIDGPLQSAVRPYSGLFHSAMPLPDGPEDGTRSSQASSRDRYTHAGYNVLYLAASLFEFNISATKKEAGYPYLTYQAGEIFDVIGEKGELWLAKNQDDPSEEVGWIWSKHFARLATD